MNNLEHLDIKNRSIITERRKHYRFTPKEGAFAMIMSAPADLAQIEDMSMGEIAMAVFKSNPAKTGQIVNISKGGLAFRYVDSALESQEPLELNILFAQEAFYLDKLPFKVVSDFDAISEFPFSSIIMKQKGLQFGEMTPHQRSKIDHFIRNYTTSEEPFR